MVLCVCVWVSIYLCVCVLIHFCMWKERLRERENENMYTCVCLCGLIRSAKPNIVLINVAGSRLLAGCLVGWSVGRVRERGGGALLGVSDSFHLHVRLCVGGGGRERGQTGALCRQRATKQPLCSSWSASHVCPDAPLTGS